MVTSFRRFAALTVALAVLCCLPFARAVEIPEPTLSPDANPYSADHPELLEEEQLYAASAILVEASTGLVIFEKNADEIMYPASTTKIMTCLLALMFADQDQMCTVTAEDITFYEDGVTNADLREGEEISMRDLLYAALLKSANDAANVIAHSVSGSISGFVDLMNEAAVSFGCTATHFANPHGLHDDYHFTTARDMAIIAREAMKNETFRDMVSTKSYTTSKTNLMRARTFSNSNYLLYAQRNEKDNKYYYPDAIGIKTGTTSRAGYCFVGAAERDGIELISVLFFTGENARWADTIKLMDYGFSQYASVTPIELYNMNPITVVTSGYSLNDTDMGRLQLACVSANQNDTTRIVTTKDQIELMAANLKDTMLITYTRELAAPIQAGEVMGTMTYFTSSGDAVEYNLVATRNVARRENAPKTLEEIVSETEADPNPFPPFTLEMALYIILPIAALVLFIRILGRLLRRRRIRNARMPKPKHRYLK